MSWEQWFIVIFLAVVAALFKSGPPPYGWRSLLPERWQRVHERNKRTDPSHDGERGIEWAELVRKQRRGRRRG